MATVVETDEYGFLTFGKFFTIITTIAAEARLNGPAILRTVAEGKYYAKPIGYKPVFPGETPEVTWFIAWAEDIYESGEMYSITPEHTATSFYVDILTVKG
jgi:hypothetical protein